jgi:hypothetical protein
VARYWKYYLRLLWIGKIIGQCGMYQGSQGSTVAVLDMRVCTSARIFNGQLHGLSAFNSFYTIFKLDYLVLFFWSSRTALLYTKKNASSF